MEHIIDGPHNQLFRIDAFAAAEAMVLEIQSAYKKKKEDKSKMKVLMSADMPC